MMMNLILKSYQFDTFLNAKSKNRWLILCGFGEEVQNVLNFGLMIRALRVSVKI